MSESVQQSSQFVQVASFSVIVPENYDHATRLATFKRKHGSEFARYNDAITDQNFQKATTRLTPGRKFTVKVFQITSRVSSEDCFALIKSEQGVLVGAQGATLAYEQGKDTLPRGRWHISLDEMTSLWHDSGYYPECRTWTLTTWTEAPRWSRASRSASATSRATGTAAVASSASAKSSA